jgi:hypothetical protein
MPRGARLVLSSLALVCGSARTSIAQGSTTGAIAGVVRDDRGIGVASADVDVRNLATGFVSRTRTRDNRRYSATTADSVHGRATFHSCATRITNARRRVSRSAGRS